MLNYEPFSFEDVFENILIGDGLNEWIFRMQKLSDSDIWKYLKTLNTVETRCSSFKIQEIWPDLSKNKAWFYMNIENCLKYGTFQGTHLIKGSYIFQICTGIYIPSLGVCVRCHAYLRMFICPRFSELHCTVNLTKSRKLR